MFVYSCNQNNGGGGASNEITITVAGDDGIALADAKTFVAKKGDKWSVLKAKATEKATPKDGKEMKEWRMTNNAGPLLSDDTVFQKDETVFAVSKNKRTEYVVTVSGDERVKIKDPGVIRIPVTEKKTIADIKAQIEAMAEIDEANWSKTHYGFYDWRIGRDDGELMLDEMEIDDDITVFARTNYTQFKKQNIANRLMLRGLDTVKPKGRVFIPNDVDTIYLRVFKGCTELTGVDFSGCKPGFGNIKGDRFDGILGAAFQGCTALRTVNLKGCTDITILNASVFEGCTSLENIDLSPCTNLKTIGARAFGECAGLKKVDFTGVSKIEKIEQGAFENCASLESVDLSSCANLKEIGSAFKGCRGIKTASLKGLSNLTKIASGLFEGCTELLEADLSSCAITVVPERMFFNCSSLKRVDFTGCGSVGYVEGEAFRNCTALESMDFSAFPNLVTIYRNSFHNCPNLKTVNFKGCGSLTKIGIEAFTGCAALEGLDLSTCVALSKLESRSFEGCEKLATLNLKGCNALVEIDFGAFLGCKELGDVDLSRCGGLTTIGGEAFNACAKAEVKLPTTITTIASKAFGESDESYCKKVLVPNAKADIKDLVTGAGYPDNEKIEMY